ncbi:hypothetical protein SAMN02745121_03111 [Nannocystis exedens]|uniref:Uncharacterized protein n=1 Tax=Nannocystis exedens TaxID=54 RepID=A0A1I1Y606_9BACT|nr:hypothetical protein [Nannocystis exedens]PCC71759.1 hypothetical protein NAEX_04838 [Nannocystis exedens]SFE13563.1 hypothetical protein SAMN02745121_03111 [Nannocystis exedens]
MAVYPRGASGKTFVLMLFGAPCLAAALAFGARDVAGDIVRGRDRLVEPGAPAGPLPRTRSGPLGARSSDLLRRPPST